MQDTPSADGPLPAQTPLDAAFEAMRAAPEDETARLRYYERLADAELMLLLAEEADGDAIIPALFPLGEVAGNAQGVLVFDREDRLSDFVGGPAPYAALSGRALVQMLSDNALGLFINLELASANMLAPDALQWLAETLGDEAQEVEALPEELHPPSGLPDLLLTALDTKLATARGAALAAYLVRVSYRGAGSGHLLAFVDPAPGAEPALTQAAKEALTFSGIEAGVLDVAFFAASDPMAATLAKVGLRFDLPKLEEGLSPSAPGSDPKTPPKLR